MQTITTQNFIFTQKDGRNWDIHFSKTKQKAGNLDIVNGFFQLEQVERATFSFSVTSDLQAVFDGRDKRIFDLSWGEQVFFIRENLQPFDYKPATNIARLNAFTPPIAMVLSEVLDYEISISDSEKNGWERYSPHLICFVRIKYDFKPYNQRSYQFESHNRQDFERVVELTKTALEKAKNDYLQQTTQTPANTEKARKNENSGVVDIP